MNSTFFSLSTKNTPTDVFNTYNLWINLAILKTITTIAKVIGPFKIVGTLDDLNFYIDQNKENLVRTKGKTGVSSEEFKRNSIFTKVKNHGKEFGVAVKKAQSFRSIAHNYNTRA